MNILNIDKMDISQAIAYINAELKKDRTQKDIEINDFGVNPGVIKNRLMRRGYRKINNQWSIDDQTTNKTTEIIQPKPIQEPQTKKAFDNNEIEKLDKLLKLDIDALNQMINDYTTKQNTNCSIKINDNSTMVTSLRVNKELYGKIQKYSKDNNIKLVDIFNDMMLDYLNNHQ